MSLEFDVSVHFHVRGGEDKKIRLAELRENGVYSVMVGKEIRLTLIGELQDLNDLAYEFYLQTCQELKSKRLEMLKPRERVNP